jgi:lysophospholipase L1-like esterase
MGESTTFGWRVRDDETYPYHLMRELNRTAPSIYVVNGGVPSYTSAQVYRYLKEILEGKILSPRAVVIDIMWNDLWYSSADP